MRSKGKVKEQQILYSILNKVRVRYQSYDFRDERAGKGRNAVHDYPAMLHSSLVAELIKEFGQDSEIIYDPFCGSGTTVVQSLINKKIAFGTDINPLALLIAKVRCSNFSEIDLVSALNELRYILTTVDPEIPKIKNIDYWFKKEVADDLGKLRRTLRLINDTILREFFLVCFSKTVRAVSYSRKGEFKRFRIASEKLIDFNPNVYKTFFDTCKQYSKILLENPVKSSLYHLYLADVRKPLPFKDNVDLIITSPPYGDSRTTVAYGEFSSFSLDWISGLNPFGDSDMSLDKVSLGGILSKYHTLDNSGTIGLILDQISYLDPKRAKDVRSFYYDLYVCCENIIKHLNKNAFVIFVVGNRKVKGIQIPMDLIIIEFFEKLGLEHLETRVRNISNKRMPSLNSPSNIIGEKSQTMSEEYIVILRK